MQPRERLLWRREVIAHVARKIKDLPEYTIVRIEEKGDNCYTCGASYTWLPNITSGNQMAFPEGSIKIKKKQENASYATNNR